MNRIVKRIVAGLALVLLASGASIAWSQQRPGGNGPLPGDPNSGWSSGGQEAPWQAPPSAPPPPTPAIYQMTFGAMAKAADDRQFAFSVGRFTAGEATAEALDSCRRRSGQDCKLVKDFHNACATLAWPVSRGPDPGRLSDVALAVEITSVHSREVALGGCERIHGAQCRVGYMACASPSLKADLHVERWSAIAIDPATLNVFPANGGGYNAASARAAAYDRCARDPRTIGECQVLDDFPAGQCRYLARSEKAIAEGEYMAIIRERPDAAVALRQCEAKAGGACRIVWQGCG